MTDSQIFINNENGDYVNEIEITINSNDKQTALFLATKNIHKRFNILT
jgi:hypothetical protein